MRHLPLLSRAAARDLKDLEQSAADAAFRLAALGQDLQRRSETPPLFPAASLIAVVMGVLTLHLAAIFIF